MSHALALRALAAALVMSPAACGGGTAAPTPVSGSTITITPAGVTPKHLLVALGSQVTFINNDSRAHDMHSDPHPEHSDCPEFDQVGFLGPGQSRQTGNLNASRICNFHDHDDAEDVRWQGTVAIQ